MSECEDIADDDERSDCFDARQQRRATFHHGLRTAISKIAGGDPAGAASDALDAGGPEALSGIADALPETLAAAALATGGRAAQHETYRRGLRQFRKLAHTIQKHVGRVEGEDHRGHAGRAPRRRG